MPAIESSRLVDAWEQGRMQHPLHRALTLLQAADPHQTIDALAALTVGERDRRLVALRRSLFGSSFDAVDTCPACAERLEFTFDVEQLPVLATPSETIDVALDGRTVAVRLPSTADLLAIAVEPPPLQEQVLLQRCTGSPVAADAAEIVEAKMEALDAMARIHLDLSCPACEHRWTGVFDILSYLWTELSDHVTRLFRETHTLARAYGWSERDILGMTPGRRRIYLDLVGA